uniref:BNLF2a-like protein n=1 Tax=Cercopithecine herpesvirus 12 TaxID=106332 RepID=A2TJU0_CHV12|nr:BNLF2a-like protein [Papiine gammaherpesvirus 1]
MVLFLHRAVLDQLSPATGLPGAPEDQKPHRCPATRELNDIRLGLAVLCILFGLLCFLLI